MKNTTDALIIYAALAMLIALTAGFAWLMHWLGVNPLWGIVVWLLLPLFSAIRDDVKEARKRGGER